jgi:hypothetical protein
LLGRVGDNYQIFPEDAHRVAFAGQRVNAYSMKTHPIRCRVYSGGAGQAGIDPDPVKTVNLVFVGIGNFPRLRPVPTKIRI